MKDMDPATRLKLYRLKKKLQNQTSDKSSKIRKRRLRAQKKSKQMSKAQQTSVNDDVNQSNNDSSDLQEKKPIKKIKLMYDAADSMFQEWFIENPFGFACSVCRRLWFKKDLSVVPKNHLEVLKNAFPGEDVAKFSVCITCKNCITKKRQIPTLSRSNGFRYPEIPQGLPGLNCISRRLISPRIFFTQIRRIRYNNSSQKITGQIINIPTDVDEMVNTLPRNLDDDYAINVHIKKHLMHKSSYMQGYVKKSILKHWLNYLITTPLYRNNNISIKKTFLEDQRIESHKNLRMDDFEVEKLAEDYADVDYIFAQQETLLWNEEKVLCIAPGQNKQPLSILMDEHAEELTFPDVYLGHPRVFSQNVHVTWFMMATSEIRRDDRRGASQEHIFYMAMKLLRLRVSQELHGCYKVSQIASKIRKKDIEDESFRKQLIEKNFCYFESIPNSIGYWHKKKCFCYVEAIG